MLVARIAMMRFIDPKSTTFQRSEIVRLATERHEVRWLQEWRPYERIADSLKRAVIASEDASFTDHGGVDWEAIEKAWERNQRAEARAEKLQARSNGSRPVPAPRIVGGSTITQQLAKNLFLSPERSLLRKGEEFVVTLTLEALLSKQRILELYLNHAEWGEGVSWRPGRRAPLLPRRCRPAQPDAGRPAGRDAAGAQALRAPARLGLCGRPRGHDRRAHGGGRSALKADTTARLDPKMSTDSLRTELAMTAARMVVEEGLEYGPAKQRARKLLAKRGGLEINRTDLPDNDEIEAEVREHLALFCADTQPGELAALREVAPGLDGAPGRVPSASGGGGLARHGHQAQ